MRPDSCVVRDGDHDELAAAHDLERVEHGNAGQHRFDPLVIRPAGDADDRVAGAPQRRSDDRADAAGPDDSDAEPSVALHSGDSGPSAGTEMAEFSAGTATASGGPSGSPSAQRWL